MRTRSPNRVARAVALAAGVIVAVASLSCRDTQPPNVVLITLDTTRADHIGAYGYAAARTPRFDAFAEQGVLYENAYSTSSWTLPSHASVFTGLLPMQHGAQTAPDGPSRDLGYTVRPLAEHFRTIAELLRESGYRTGAVIAGPALRTELGVAQGFEVYDDTFQNATAIFNGRRAREVADRAIEIANGFGDQPYFLFVNFFDPHAPYRPPGPHGRDLPKIDAGPLTAALIERLREQAQGATARELDDWQREVTQAMSAGYDAELAYLDLHLGRLLEAVDPDNRALVVITSDHGESFGEHDQLSHGAHLYEDNIRVPLVVRYPETRHAGRRVAAPIQNYRLFATILNEVGVEIPSGVTAPGLDAGDAWVVTEVRRSDNNVSLFGEIFDRDLRALYAPPYKLIESSTGRRQLFDLERDAAEHSDLSESDPELRDRLSGQLAEIQRAHPPLFDPTTRAELSPETEEALRALGYLD